MISIDESDEEDEPQVLFASIHNQKRNNNTSKHEEGGIIFDTDSNVFKMNNNNHSLVHNHGPIKKRRFDDYGEVIQ